MSIEIRNLTHCYSQGSALTTVALNDVSFVAEDGDGVAGFGSRAPTGSGGGVCVCACHRVFPKSNPPTG